MLSDWFVKWYLSSGSFCRVSIQIGDGFRKVEFAPDGGIDVAVTVGGVKEDFGGCTTFECLDDVRDGEATVVTVLRAETEVAINDE